MAWILGFLTGAATVYLFVVKPLLRKLKMGTTYLTPSRAKESDMHYRNGREAKNGDKIVESFKEIAK